VALQAIFVAGVLMLNTPDLESLRMLVGVGASGSLSNTARDVGVSQQAVSVRMAALEKVLGIPLLTRSPHGTQLTAAGILVANWAALLLAEADRFETATQALRTNVESALAIASSMTIAEHLAPGWLIRLRSQSPDLRVELTAGNSEAVVTMVRSRSVALGFVETPDLPSDLRCATFASDELVVVVGPSHPWARRRSGITAEELASASLVTRERGSGTRLAFDRTLASAGFPLQAEPAAEFSTTSAIRSTVMAGQVASVLSILAVREHLAAGALVRVRVRDLRIIRPLTAIWNPSVRLHPAAEQLLAIASQVDGDSTPPAQTG
jgi:molybdate transport repressor ModE-like protein